MNLLNDRRKLLKQKRDEEAEKSAFTPSYTRTDMTSSGITEETNKTEPLRTGNALADARNRIKFNRTYEAPKPEPTPMEQVTTNNDNYQKRLDFEGLDYQDEPTFKEKALSAMGKLFDNIDRVRNATWVAAKSAGEAGESNDLGKIFKAMGEGAVRGFKREEVITGDDMVDEIFGEKKADASGLEKTGRFVGSLAAEIFLDPLTYVTLGTGGLAKGLLTGVGKSLSDDAIKGVAKAATAQLTPDNVYRAMRVAFDNPEAFGKVGKITAEQIGHLKTVKELAPDLKTFNNLKKVIAGGDEAGVRAIIGDKTFSSFSDLKKAFEASDTTLRDLTRAEIKAMLEETAPRFGLSADDITHYTDKLNLDNLKNIDEDVVKPMVDYISNRTLKQSEEAILKNPKLSGKGLSAFGVTKKTGAEMQNMGAKISDSIRQYGLNHDGAKAVLARGYSGFQEATGTVFSKYFTKGVDAETNKVFKALINANDARKGLKDSDTVEKVLTYRKKLTDIVDKKYKHLSGDEKLAKVEALEGGVSDFLELGRNPKTISKLMIDDDEEIIEAIDAVAESIRKDLAEMGIAEAQIGKLNNIMDGYLPHVRNTDLSKLSKKEIRELNLARMGEEDDFLEAVKRQTGQSGIKVGQDFSTINKSAKMRHYAGTVDHANKMKLLNSSTQNAASKFIKRIQTTQPEVYKALTGNNYIKIHDGVPRFNTLVESPENLRELMDLIPADAWDNLDGVQNFFETSAIKAYMARAMKHNQIMMQSDNARDVLNSIGTFIHRFDYQKIRDMQAKGHDIVVTKGFFENMDVKSLMELSDAAGENGKFIQDLIRSTTDSEEAWRSLSTHEIDQLLSIIDTKKIPIEVYAVPSAIRKTFNSLAKQQVDTGFQTLGKAIDTLHRMWKPLVTGFRPDFHIRNLGSSTMNDFLDNGIKSFDPRYKAMAAKVRHGSKSVIEIGGEKFTGDEIYRMMKEQGAFSNMTREFSSDAMDEALRLKMKSSTRSVGKKVAGTYEKSGHIVGNAIENNLRASNFLINLERGLENALDVPMAVKYAADKVREFHFDYSDLSNVERKLLRRIAPFYTWSRKNIPLQLEKFLDNPSLYEHIGDVSELSAEQFGVDQGDLPRWAQNTLPITTPFKDENGNPVMVAGMFPQADLSDVLSNPKEFMTEQLAGMSPMFKAPIEMTINKSFLTGAPIYRTEAEKKQKLLEYAISQTGILRDATNTLTGQKSSDGEFSGMEVAPFGVGKSILKTHNADAAKYNRAMDYNRYLADVVQGYKNTGSGVATLNDIKRMEKVFEETYGKPSSGNTLNERRKSLGGK